MEMADGVLQAPSFLSAEGEGPEGGGARIAKDFYNCYTTSNR